MCIFRLLINTIHISMKHIIFTTMVAVMLSCQQSYCSENAKPATTGDVPSTVHDFGKMADTENPVHRFTVANSTSGKFKILQIRVPCGCASTKLDKDMLESGESASFEITFYLKGLLGPVSKNIYVVTDSKDLPLIKYSMKAEIVPKPSPICEAPVRIDAGKIPPGETRKLTFKIENKGLLDLKIEKGTAGKSIELIKEFPITIAPGKSDAIELSYTSPAFEGVAGANFMLKTNDPRKPEVWMHVAAEVVK
ncbi:MAG: DUF1573 domain-containing protein, partial [Victivallales bacterium]